MGDHIVVTEQGPLHPEVLYISLAWDCALLYFSLFVGS